MVGCITNEKFRIPVHESLMAEPKKTSGCITIKVSRNKIYLGIVMQPVLGTLGDLMGTWGRQWTKAIHRPGDSRSEAKTKLGEVQQAATPFVNGLGQYGPWTPCKKARSCWICYRISKDILGYTCIYMDNIEIGPIGNLNWDIPTKPRLSVTDKTWGLGQSWATNKTQSAGHLPHESIQFCG